MAYVISIQAVRELVKVKEVLLECTGNGRLDKISYRIMEPTLLTFPLALRPVSQMVAPFCLRSSDRSALVTEPRKMCGDT